jgi:hypothetical protein
MVISLHQLKCRSHSALSTPPNRLAVIFVVALIINPILPIRERRNSSMPPASERCGDSLNGARNSIDHET